jgi:hypothetical protein
MIWKNLKIKSIAVKNGEITIECEKGDEEKHIYFITIRGVVLSIYDDKRNLLDSMNIPSDFEYTYFDGAFMEPPKYKKRTIVDNPSWSNSWGTTKWEVENSNYCKSSNSTVDKDALYKITFGD